MIIGKISEKYIVVLLSYNEGKSLSETVDLKKDISVETGEVAEKSRINIGMIGAGLFAKTILLPLFKKYPYEKRENGFVCIGRIVPEKRIDTIIEILEKVRQKGHDVHLHIIGGIVSHPKLVYENIEDGVQKIEIVLKNERLQNNLREHLSLVSQKSIREIVSNFLKGKICLK